MFDFVTKKSRFFIVSGVVILAGIISLAGFGLKSGIEFSSGSQLTLKFENEVAISEMKQELDELGYSNAIVQTTGSGNFIIRTSPLTDAEKTQLETDLESNFGALTEEGFINVDPVTAGQTANIAIIAVAVAAVGIMLYVTWAFRRMPKPFRYGTCAIIALLHDTVIVLGIFSIIGGIMGWEINLMFITGILAVIGYSVNNTVVIFDRIRENLLRQSTSSFKVIVNKSLVENLTRSVNTSLTTLIVVLALLFFVGSGIQNFAVVLIIGIVVGTYSSLFIAPSLLVAWEDRELNRSARSLPQKKTSGR